MPDLQTQSEVVTDLAKVLMTFVRETIPTWRAAYFRAYVTPSEEGQTASVVDANGVQLIGAVRNAALYNAMAPLCRKLFAGVGMESGVFLLTCLADYSYDLKFERDDLSRWAITKMDGKSGIPEGESPPA